MKKKSACILLYRIIKSLPEFLLIHPGGPSWAKKDEGSWSIRKGEFAADKHVLNAAKREMQGVTWIRVGNEFIELTPLKQKGGKRGCTNNFRIRKQSTI